MFYWFISTLLKPIVYILFRPRVYGKEKLPRKGRAVLYSNHTNFMDPILLLTFLPRRIFFMAKADIFKNALFSLVLRKMGVMPVRRGEADITAIKESLKVLKRENVFGIFPEGTRNRVNRSLQEFLPGVAAIAHRTQSPIYPVAILDPIKPLQSVRIVVGDALDMKEFYSKAANKSLLASEAEMMKQVLTEMLKKGEKHGKDGDKY